MNPPQSPDLARTQREFFSALNLPLRGRSRAATELPATDDPHDPAFLRTADQLIRSSPTLEPAECLELYHRQYWFRLLDSLEEDFPGLIDFLGQGAFWQTIEAYLLEYGSTSFTLRHLGQHLAQFIKKSESSDPATTRRAAALAELEYALMAAFETAEAPVAAPEQVAGGTFSLQPYVTPLALPANASEWLHDHNTPWRDDGTETFYAVVWRTSTWGIHHEALSAGAYHMLTTLAKAPTTLNDWLTRCDAHVPEAETLTAWFTQWNQREWFAREEAGQHTRA